MQITRLRYTRLDYSALGFLYSTYNAGVRYKALSSVLFPIPNTLCRRCFIVVLSAMGKHLEISEWANYRTVGTEVVGRIARFDWSPRGTREDCGSRGDCGNPRDESLSFNLRALSRVLFLFESWSVFRVNFLLYARAEVCLQIDI